MVRIGIADPSPEISNLIEATARRLGHETFAVKRAEDVERGCDVLVAEPGSTLGLEAARRLRAHKPRAPIVLVSIFPRHPDTAELEPIAHLVKPFALGELMAALRAAVEHADD